MSEKPWVFICALPLPCCVVLGKSLNICTADAYLERKFNLTISRFSGSHSMVYAYKDVSVFCVFFFNIFVSTSQRIQTSNQKHVEGGTVQWNRISFSNGMSCGSYTPEHSPFVCLMHLYTTEEWCTLPWCSERINSHHIVKF